MFDESKYEPKTVRDFLFGCEESSLRISDLASGAEQIPSAGVSGVLLYGTFGTGKTTLAKILPDAIERGKTGEELGWPAEFISCQQGSMGPQIMMQIQAILNKNSLIGSGLHYFILDEVDNLTKAAQQSLKSAMNTTRGVFILTTNYFSSLDKGMLNRCLHIEMHAPQEHQILDFARRIAADCSVDLSDIELLQVIKPAQGSFRQVIKGVHRIARRKLMRLAA